MRVSELSKPTCEWCKHANPKHGCTIYEDRPQSCRDFQCFWLYSQSKEKPLSDSLRPDRSHVVIDSMANGNEGFVFHVDPARSDAHEKGAIAAVKHSLLKLGMSIIVVCGERCTLQKYERGEG